MPDFVQKAFDYLYKTWGDRIRKDPNVDWMYCLDRETISRRDLVHRIFRAASADKFFMSKKLINQWITLKYRTTTEEPGNHSTYDYEDEPETDRCEDPSIDIDYWAEFLQWGKDGR